MSPVMQKGQKPDGFWPFISMVVGGGTRTLGTRIFSPLLYQLSYPTGYAETVSVSTRAYILAGMPPRCKNFFV